MEEVVKKDIISIIIRVINILMSSTKSDVVEVKDLSNRTIHNASIFQDEDSISIAILIYSMSKVIYRKKTSINYAIFIDLFKEALANLENDDPDAYRRSIKKMFRELSIIDKKIRFYIEEVFNQAQISKGTKLYEHGISVARASEVLGISQWDLMDYIGKTGLTDAFEKENISVKDRLRYTRNLFR